MPRNAFRPVLVALVLVASVLAARNAYTIPRYSARYGQECSLCHMNPTGGGERSLYASQFIVPEEMAVVKLDEEARKKIDPRLSRTITAGVDLRTFFFRSNSDTPNLSFDTQNFMQMQGNLYLDLQLDERFSATMSRGMSGEYEVFGMGYILPLNGYVKVGRFMPAYGWRFADHTSFVRELMGFFPPAHTDVGMEAGIYPGRGSLTLSLMNGSRGSIQDTDKNVALWGRASYRWTIGKAQTAFGGSFYYHRKDALTTRYPLGVSGTDRTAGGPFGYVSVGPFTWVGEADISRNTFPDVSDSTLTYWFTTHEVTWDFVQGADLRGTFDYLDANTDQDYPTYSRYGIGAEVMPYPFVKVTGMVNFWRSKPEPGIGKNDYTQGELQVHFFY
jgi:hypothetical protein